MRSDVILGLTVAWIVFAVLGLPAGLYIAYDAYRDVRARAVARMNHGRETLARLLVVTSSLLSFAFLVFLLVGIYALSPYSRMEGPWRGLVIPAGLVMAEAALSFMLIYKHRVRRRVLLEDLASDDLHRQAAVLLAANTEALQANTEATQDATDAMREGG